MKPSMLVVPKVGNCFSHSSANKASRQLSQSFISKQSIQKARRWNIVSTPIKKSIRSIFPSRSSHFNDRLRFFSTETSSHLSRRSFCHNILVAISRSLREACPNCNRPYLRYFKSCNAERNSCITDFISFLSYKELQVLSQRSFGIHILKDTKPPTHPYLGILCSSNKLI